jgi:hypothetical protein
MPSLVKDLLFRNFKGLEFDGSNDSMRSSANSDWDVDTSDFILALCLNSNGSKDRKEVVVSKDDNAKFAVEVDWSGTNKHLIFNMNSTAMTAGGGASAFIVLCGRSAGKQFVRIRGEETIAESADTSDLTVNAKPRLAGWGGLGLSHMYTGSIYEVVFINNALNVVLDMESWIKPKLEGYLAWKYGLVSHLVNGHRYKERPPRVGGS